VQIIKLMAVLSLAVQQYFDEINKSSSVAVVFVLVPMIIHIAWRSIIRSALTKSIVITEAADLSWIIAVMTSLKWPLCGGIY
jgi:hypothetical protein